MDCSVTNNNMTFFYLIMLWFVIVITEGKYEPKWNSLDTRPLPQWYDNAKVGIFIHWGVFSVPSFGSEWFWKSWSDKDQPYIQFMTKNYPVSYTYQGFAKDFTAEFFNATQWAELFMKSGAKYVVLTSKHHEGYTMWPSKYSYSWNSQDVGPRRDIVGELGEAVKKHKLIYGLYHSLYEWFNPMYLFDKSKNLTTQEFVLKKVLPEMYELVEKYEPGILWSDGDWEAPDTYWKSTEFLAWLYNESPVRNIVVTNDRWGINITCEHGDFYTCKDRYNPGTLQKHKWENAMTIDKHSWGFRRNAILSDYCTITELLYQLVSTVSCGGNILINIGPTKDGIIAPIFEERLLQLGEWLSLNGEAIYATMPWKSQNDTLAKDVWYTSKGSVVYAIVLNWHDNLKLADSVKLFNSGVTVTMVGNEQDGPLKWTVDNKRVYITFPSKSKVVSRWAYVLKIYSDFFSVNYV